MLSMISNLGNALALQFCSCESYNSAKARFLDPQRDKTLVSRNRKFGISKNRGHRRHS